MFKVYIIKSKKTGGFYIGYTTDLDRRLSYHNNNLSRYTRGKGPWVLVYQEAYNTKREAIIRERFLKKQKNISFYNKLIGA